MQDIYAPFKGGNRHVVDRLAELRLALKDGNKLEEELKAEVSREMGRSDSLGGSEFVATQSISERRGKLLEKKIAMALGVDNLDWYRGKATEVVTIRTNRRGEVEE